MDKVEKEFGKLKKWLHSVRFKSASDSNRYVYIVAVNRAIEEAKKRVHVRALKYCRMKKALIIVSVALLISLIGNICQAGTVADTLYLEARGEGEQGIKAVASVIYNRAKGDSGKFKAVCLKPFQFSCWNSSKTRVIAPKTASDKKAMEICLQVEKELYTSNFKPLGDWTHYYNSKLCNPSWAKNTSITKIGNHNFLKTK